MLAEDGYIIIEKVFTAGEVNNITSAIEASLPKDAFATRQVFRELPILKPIVFNKALQKIIHELFGEDYFLVKAIYFDKPALSNWFVAYHQDLSIAVDKKVDIAGFNNWTNKNDQYNVQPPQEILESIFTIRIHLDDCTKENGALYVKPGSHKNGITRSMTAEIDEVACEVEKGGIMIMKPLLWHASRKNTIERNRRVLHLEFCNRPLPSPIDWAEKINIL